MSRLSDLLRGGHGELVDQDTGRPVSIGVADALDLAEGELHTARDHLRRIRNNKGAWDALDPADRTMIDAFLS